MKKILLLAVMTLTFVGCSSDDDDYSASDLVGKWEWIASEGWEIKDGIKRTYNESYVNDEYPSYTIINKDGTGKNQETYSNETYDTEFTWSLSGNKITTKTRLETLVNTILKLDAANLVYEGYYTSDNNEYYYKNTFIKVK